MSLAELLKTMGDNPGASFWLGFIFLTSFLFGCLTLVDVAKAVFQKREPKP